MLFYDTQKSRPGCPRVKHTAGMKMLRRIYEVCCCSMRLRLFFNVCVFVCVCLGERERLKNSMDGVDGVDPSRQHVRMHRTLSI